MFTSFFILYWCQRFVRFACKTHLTSNWTHDVSAFVFAVNMCSVARANVRPQTTSTTNTKIKSKRSTFQWVFIRFWSGPTLQRFEFFRFDIELLWSRQETIAFGSVACGRTASQYNNLSINWKLEKKKTHSRVSCCCTQRTESTSFRIDIFLFEKKQRQSERVHSSELRARSATAISTHSLLLLLFIRWRSRWAAVWQRKITIFNLYICEQRQQ